ncbi:MAG: hypothetical protein Q9190_006158 [Brigantiaea leucoxantha]
MTRRGLESDGKSYDKIVIGAIVPKQDPGPNSDILLLKRTAHEEFYPNTFEIPGGKVEESDPTILDAIKREVFEETGMAVEKVIGAVGSFDYFTEKKAAQEDGEGMPVLSISLQLNFICQVIGHDLLVNPEEHSEGKFFSRSDIKELEATEQMKAVVEEGFIWIETHPGELKVSNG